jgi:hypothetical protein
VVLEWAEWQCLRLCWQGANVPANTERTDSRDGSLKLPDLRVDPDALLGKRLHLRDQHTQEGAESLLIEAGWDRKSPFRLVTGGVLLRHLGCKTLCETKSVFYLKEGCQDGCAILVARLGVARPRPLHLRAL